MTFSIAARCAETGMFGVAIASSSPAVAARCAYTQAGVGAVASQNITDPGLGPQSLQLMSLGASARQAIDVIKGSGSGMDFRQVLAVDTNGGSAIHSGPNALGLWGEACDVDVACGGNLLATEEIPGLMVAAFKDSGGYLGDRLLGVMKAALRAGGEAGQIHSAGLQLADKVEWPVADLRVDWLETCPIDALGRIWGVYKPQLDDYVIRALHPEAAPSYGVPGDE